MGQSVVTVMYGIKASKELRNGDGENFWSVGAKRLDWDDSPRNAYEGCVVGFSVAVSGGCDNDEDYLGESCLFADFAKQHAKAIARAKRRWDKFAEWALKVHGRKLPAAALWITTDERA
jgi:hypothetical protein